MKLHKLHVDEFRTRVIGHRNSAAGTIPTVTGYLIYPAHSSGRNDDGLRVKNLESSTFAIIAECANDVVVIGKQLNDRVLLVKIYPLVDAMILKRAYHFKSRPITDVCETRIFVSSKIALQYSSILSPVEQGPPRLEFSHAIRGFLREQFSHSPVVEILAAAHGIGKVYFPVVAVINISQRRSHAAFRHDRVRFSQQGPAHHTDGHASGRSFNRRAQAGATRADDKHIVIVCFEIFHSDYSDVGPDSHRYQSDVNVGERNAEEGWRYTQGDKNAKRPPELLTRDHVARCIRREIKEGRGTEHGGVFLDISWIREKLPNAAEHIRKKLPSMYHQFRELAGVDITKEPMEVGPTTHYIMGGIRVDPDTQMTRVPGLFAAGECAAGLHGANRLGGNSLSDLLVFGKRAGQYAAVYSKEIQASPVDPEQVAAFSASSLAPFERNSAVANPYNIQAQLQEMMQDLVGIARTGDELTHAIENISALRKEAEAVSCGGNRGYNPGWHTALELTHMLTVAEAIARAASERRESRGGHFREDFPEKSQELGKVNISIVKGAGGKMQVGKVPKADLRADLQDIVDEMK